LGSTTPSPIAASPNKFKKVIVLHRRHFLYMHQSAKHKGKYTVRTQYEAMKTKAFKMAATPPMNHMQWGCRGR